MAGCGIMFGNPSFGAKSLISERINNLAYYATLYPPKTKNPTEDLPQQKGSFNECMFNLIAQQYFPKDSIEFNENKAWKQFLEGRDGRPDEYDIVVNGIRIDVKYDSKMYNSDKICFEIKNKSGKSTLLLNNNVDCSAHMYYFESNLPKVLQGKANNKGLQLVIVDLHSLRQFLTEEDGYYRILDCFSRQTMYETTVIDVPIKYLTHRLKVADLFIY